MNCLLGVIRGILLLALFFALTVTSVCAANDPLSGQNIVQLAMEQVKNLYAGQQGDAIYLRWQAVSLCDGYRVYHETGDTLLPGSFWYDVDVSQFSNLFLDVTAGGHYTFSVSALYGTMEGPPSAPVTVIMKDSTIIGPSDTADQ